MSFVHVCVGIVVTIAIFLVTFIFNAVVTNEVDINNVKWRLAWFVSAIGFGICLTMLLFQNGIIKM